METNPAVRLDVHFAYGHNRGVKHLKVSLHQWRQKLAGIVINILCCQFVSMGADEVCNLV